MSAGAVDGVAIEASESAAAAAAAALAFATAALVEEAADPLPPADAEMEPDCAEAQKAQKAQANIASKQGVERFSQLIGNRLGGRDLISRLVPHILTRITAKGKMRRAG